MLPSWLLSLRTFTTVCLLTDGSFSWTVVAPARFCSSGQRLSGSHHRQRLSQDWSYSMKLRERERSGKITTSKRQMKDTMTDTPTERKVQTVWEAGSYYYINFAVICSKCFNSGNLGQYKCPGTLQTMLTKVCRFHDESYGSNYSVKTVNGHFWRINSQTINKSQIVFCYRSVVDSFPLILQCVPQ